MTVTSFMIMIHDEINVYIVTHHIAYHIQIFTHVHMI